MTMQSLLFSALLAAGVTSAAMAASQVEGSGEPEPSWASVARHTISKDVIRVVSPESFAARFSRKAMPQKESYTYKLTRWADDGVVFEVHKYDGRAILTADSLSDDTLHSVGFYNAATGKVNWPIE